MRISPSVARYAPLAYADLLYLAFWVNVPCPLRPQCFIKRERNSTLARINLDFAAGTERPSRSATVPIDSC